MKKIAYIFLLLVTITGIQSCEDTFLPEALEYITFGDTTYSTGVDVGGTTTVEIPVYTGNITSNERTFNLITDGTNAASGSYTVPSTITIPANSNEGSVVVTLSDVDLGIGVNKVSISLEDGTSYSIGKPVSVQYMQNCTEITGTLEITFDGYANETYWQITDALGGEVISKVGYTDGQVSVTENITLCAGRDYTFTIYDSFGDGMSYPNNGTYTLSVNGDVKATGGGDFGKNEATPFDTK